MQEPHTPSDAMGIAKAVRAGGNANPTGSGGGEDAQMVGGSGGNDHVVMGGTSGEGAPKKEPDPSPGDWTVEGAASPALSSMSTAAPPAATPVVHSDG